MGDTMREAFEKWAKREFSRWHHKPIPGTPIYESCRKAHEAGRQLGMEQEHALWLMANDAAERKLYERLTTPPAGDSDTKEN